MHVRTFGVRAPAWPLRGGSGGRTLGGWSPRPRPSVDAAARHWGPRVCDQELSTTQKQKAEQNGNPGKVLGAGGPADLEAGGGEVEGQDCPCLWPGPDPNGRFPPEPPILSTVRRSSSQSFTRALCSLDPWWVGACPEPRTLQDLGNKATQPRCPLDILVESVRGWVADLGVGPLGGRKPGWAGRRHVALAAHVRGRESEAGPAKQMRRPC